MASGEPRPCVCEIYNQSLERDTNNKSDNKRPKNFSPFAGQRLKFVEVQLTSQCYFAEPWFDV